MSEYKADPSKAKSWELATVRKKGDKTFLAFDKSVRILVGDREVDMGEYHTLFLDKKDKLLEDIDFKVGKGWLTEEQAEAARNRLEEKGVSAGLRAKLK